jgi:YdjC-like protein
MNERAMDASRGAGPDQRRRSFLRRSMYGAGAVLGAVAVLARRPGPAYGEQPESDDPPDGADPIQRLVVVNADDLGLSEEFDDGIFEAHDRGIVTSASLMVDGPHPPSSRRADDPAWVSAPTWPSTTAVAG